MNRHYIIASHAHFAKGLYESVKLLVGEHADVDILNAFVDGNDDIEKEALALVDACSDNVDVVVLTDLMGGSINSQECVSGHKYKSSAGTYTLSLQ